MMNCIECKAEKLQECKAEKELLFFFFFAFYIQNVFERFNFFMTKISFFQLNSLLVRKAACTNFGHVGYSHETRIKGEAVSGR